MPIAASCPFLAVWLIPHTTSCSKMRWAASFRSPIKCTAGPYFGCPACRADHERRCWWCVFPRPRRRQKRAWLPSRQNLLHHLNTYTLTSGTGQRAIAWDKEAMDISDSDNCESMWSSRNSAASVVVAYILQGPECGEYLPGLFSPSRRSLACLVSAARYNQAVTGANLAREIPFAPGSRSGFFARS